MKLLAFVSALSLAIPALVQGVPEHNNWKLTIECGRPRALTVTSKGGAPRTVWCLPFDVKNATGAAHTFLPYLQMTTETGKTYNATYMPSAVETLSFYTGEKYVDVFELAGGLEDGATKRCVAVFEDVDSMANKYTYHFSGFASPLWRSGATFTQQNVVYRAMFSRDGNEYQVASARVKHEGSEWATVETKKVR